MTISSIAELQTALPFETKTYQGSDTSRRNKTGASMQAACLKQGCWWPLGFAEHVFWRSHSVSSNCLLNFPSSACSSVIMSGLSFSLGGGDKKRPAAKFGFNLKVSQKPSKPLGAFQVDSDDEDKPDIPDAKKQKTEFKEDVGVVAPQDPEVKKAVDKLAEFVARNGRGFEEITRQRNPSSGPFRFLFNTTSSEYKYYEFRLSQEEATMKGVPAKDAAPTPPPSTAWQPKAEYTGQASRFDSRVASNSNAGSSNPGSSRPNRFSEVKTEKPGGFGAGREAKAVKAEDSMAAMAAFEALAKKHEESRVEKEQKIALLNETSFDRRRQVAVYKQDGTRGHHMQDYIPPEELAKLLAKGGDKVAAAQASAIEEASKISSDNIGHKMLAQMGWKEGSGLGAQASGIAAPIVATGVKQDNLGVGAAVHGEVQEGDDAFELYRKRMILGYKHRPNPLGNPRKSYY